MRRPTNSAVALTPRRNAVPLCQCGMILVVPVCHDGRLRLRLPWPGGGRWCRKSCQRWLLLVEAAAAAARRLAIRLATRSTTSGAAASAPLLLVAPELHRHWLNRSTSRLKHYRCDGRVMPRESARSLAFSSRTAKSCSSACNTDVVFEAAWRPFPVSAECCARS
jgi:hypothetical protein